MKKNYIFMFIAKFITLVCGLFILALGIALSTKSGLGVSPSASLAYVLSEIFPLSMGNFTTLINVFFVIVQILLLRRDYKPVNLLQLGVVFIFGYFTDLTLAMVAPIELSAYPVRFAVSILSCLVMALGVFLEVKANLIVMASEGAISAISSKTGKDFGTVKILIDWGFIILSTIISLAVFHKLSGIREGTIIAAFLVGMFVRVYNRRIHFFDRFADMADGSAESVVLPGADVPLVITIERELGSGGHEIGERIARELGIAFYNYALISRTATEMGLAADEISKEEERIDGGLVETLRQNNYAMSTAKSRQDEIFEAQEKVIRNLASKESCVIVGRLGAFILKGRPNTLNLFFSADTQFRAERIAAEHHIEVEQAKKIIEQEDSLRRNYCVHFTGEPWGLASHYGMALHTSDYGIDKSAELVLEAAKL